jgi:hypothetical protein
MMYKGSGANRRITTPNGQTVTIKYMRTLPGATKQYAVSQGLDVEGYAYERADGTWHWPEQFMSAQRGGRGRSTCGKSMYCV